MYVLWISTKQKTCLSLIFKMTTKFTPFKHSQIKPPDSDAPFGGVKLISVRPSIIEIMQNFTTWIGVEGSLPKWGYKSNTKLPLSERVRRSFTLTRAGISMPSKRCVSAGWDSFAKRQKFVFKMANQLSRLVDRGGGLTLLIGNRGRLLY